MSTNKQKFSVIGCGRVGVSLAVFLRKKGFVPAGFFSKTPESARFAREMAGEGQVFERAEDCARAGDILFITTPDTRIGPVARDLARAGGFREMSLVFHLSGALSSDILAPARDAGADTGSIHPLQAFTPYEPGQVNPFRDINISVEGSDRAVAMGKTIVTALGARAFAIPTHAKTLYHASAVVASNYLVALEDFALSLLMETGLGEAEAYDILEPLILGTLANIKAKGCAGALTGPVARGDHDIVSAHIRDIDAKTPGFSELYRVLGRHTLDLAKKGGGPDDAAAGALSRLFSEKQGRS